MNLKTKKIFFKILKIPLKKLSPDQKNLKKLEIGRDTNHQNLTLSASHSNIKNILFNITILRINLKQYLIYKIIDMIYLKGVYALKC